MSASDKSKRTPPARVFEDYILTRTVSTNVGLSNIPEDRFIRPISSVLGAGAAPKYANEPGAYAAQSDILSIGFNFLFDGITYNKFVISTSGWIALIDPLQTNYEIMFDPPKVTSAGSTGGPGEPEGHADGTSKNNWRNANINLDEWTSGPTTYKHVLLAPWLDWIGNREINHYQSPEIIQTKQGLTSVFGLYDQKDWGIRYCLEENNATGKRLVIRWTSTSNPALWAFIYTNVKGLILKFEVIIYENGKIEFRYDNFKNAISVDQAVLDTLKPNKLETATIGIFSWKSNNFRDFSSELYYTSTNGDARNQYKYGGYVYDSSYTDSITCLDNWNVLAALSGSIFTAKYSIGLNPEEHWPAGPNGLTGAVFTFQPPMLRRKVLPKLETQVKSSAITLPTILRTGASTQGNNKITFDDRRTITFKTGTSIVNYPVVLPRFYANSEDGIAERQNLFVGDFEITQSIVKSLSDQFVGNIPTKYISAFQENNRPDQAASSTTSQFYLTGTKLEDCGGGLANSLRSKTQIRLSLPINNITQMNSILPFDNEYDDINDAIAANAASLCSNIYFYNKLVKQWMIPKNSYSPLIYDINDVLWGLAANLDISSPEYYLRTKSTPEDARGFGAIGNTIVSGTTVVDYRVGSHQYIGSQIVDNQIPALTTLYENSIQNNQKYFPIDNETFEIPISQPFILEKATFEIPISMINDWFVDLTTSTKPISASSAPLQGPKSIFMSGTFDFAGPAITLSLFNSRQIGEKRVMDLILTGTITHEFDNTSTVHVCKDPGMASYCIRPVGFKSFAAIPSAVVTPNEGALGYTFSGSVMVPTVAAVSNGIIARYDPFNMFNSQSEDLSITPTQFSTIYTSFLRTLLTSPEINLEPHIPSQFSPSVVNASTGTILQIDPFGRAATGFNPAGRSLFGKEFIQSEQNLSKIRNPLYVSASYDLLPAHMQAMINDSLLNPPGVFAAIPLGKTTPSPYLLYPGDKLVLAISKTRPALYSNMSSSLELFSGSRGSTINQCAHPVTLETGSINISMYGSLLRENKEFHDTLNQHLSSDAIHEIVIGSDPVLDQFDVCYRNELYGSMQDNYITGSMFTKTIVNGKQVFTATSRGSVFSKIDASLKPSPATTGYELTVNKSTAFRSTKWHERAGDIRVMSFTSPTERFYDSMLPHIRDCVRINDAAFTIITTDGPQGQIYFNSGKNFLKDLYVAFGSTADQANATKTATDDIWMFSYPYESRYSSVTRQVNIEKSFIVDHNLGATGVTNIKPIQTSEIWITFVGQHAYDKDRISSNTINFYDTYPALGYATRFAQIIAHDSNAGTGANLNLSIDDAVRIIYGFGDLNNIQYVAFDATLAAAGTWVPDTTKGLVGANHMPDYRKVVSPNSSNATGISPVIRGWKYGISHGLPTYTKSYYRRTSYGQFRDQLEQRLFTKFYQYADEVHRNDSTLEGPITIKFVESVEKKPTKPENTWSMNLSHEATSSLPYFDGEVRNRNDINLKTLNTNVVSLTTTTFGNVTI